MDFTQYQHYIPQFMLRRFAVDQPINPSKVSKSDQKKEKDRYKYNCTIKVLNLGAIPPEITDDLVRKTFGRRGMYNNGLDDRIEKKLANIEQNVSQIIARVLDAHKAGKDGISLVRSEKDLLRKFQFVMRYRSPIFFDRFNHQTAEDYNSDDKEEFKKYMRDLEESRPLDVWFHNLKKMIDIAMDPECHWVEELRKAIYPNDADWFIENIQSMYMAFVTPLDPKEEFIITENAFGIHEGPVSYVDRFTGEKKRIAYPEFHLLTVISPRLAIVFRNKSLPEPHEDDDLELRKLKLLRLATMAQMHADPENVTSLLEDLPIARARRPELAEDADGVLRMDDKFDFVFFPINSKHVQTINMMMLDEAYEIEKLAFRSEAALLKAIEFYLEYPCLTRGLYSRKTVSYKPDDPKLRHLKKMEHVARMLGSSATAKYHVDPLWEGGHAMRLEIAVALVLATTTDTPEKNPIVLGTEILMNTLKKMETNIMVKAGPDQIQESMSVFPDAVYRCIQETCRKKPGPRTKHLLKIDRRSLILSWVDIFSEAIGYSENGNVTAMREKLSQFVNNLYAETTREPERPMKSASGLSVQAPISQQDSSSGFSRKGLNRAFEHIGQDMESEETPSSAQSLADESFSHPEADVVEGNEESDSAQPPEEMVTQGDASLGNALTVAPAVLSNNRDSNTTPSFSKFAIFAFFYIFLALPLMILALVLMGLALAVMSIALTPLVLTSRKGGGGALLDKEPFRTNLLMCGFCTFGIILWWFAYYWHLLPNWLPNEPPSISKVAALLFCFAAKIMIPEDPW